MNYRTWFSRRLGRAFFAGLILGSLAAAPLLADGVTTTVSATTASITNYEPPGSFNALEVINGGYLTNTATTGNHATMIGGPSTTYNSNSMLVSGPSSVYDQASGGGFGYFYVGWLGDYNQLTITNGGTVINRAATLTAIGEGGINNLALITGGGSTWTNSNYLSVGDFSSLNRMQIDNGGTVFNADGYIGGSINGGAGTRNSNSVLVTGINSLWQNNGNLYLGYVASGGWNQLAVSNSGRVVNSIGYLGYGSGSNSVLVTGPGSVWSNTSILYIGYLNSQSNRLVVADGGIVRATDAFVGGPFAGDKRNSLLVTDSNSLLQASGFFYVGWVDNENDLVIANGGRVNVTGAGQLTVLGESASSRNNTGLVTGPGSTLSSVSSGFHIGDEGAANRLTISNRGLVTASAMVVAGNTASASNNSIFVTANGVLESATGLRAGSAVGNSISNVGGIYQFTTATPTITPNGAGRIAITDGTISYRDVSAANIFNTQIANIAFAGDNTFRLHNSSNSSIAAYTFDTGLGATNYHRLELVNGTTRWATTGGTTIGAGGSVLASNTMATIDGSLTIHGSYVSDPSTNTFLADVTVGQGGTIAGGIGDLFDFKKSLFIHSTNQIGFNLAHSAVEFSGGGMHTNAITGMNLGGGVAAYDAAFTLQTNFAYGELHLGSASDQICFTCGNIPTVSSNGLYIGWLDLLGNASLVTNLHVDSGITLYYDATDVRNAYLGGLSYALTDCDFVAAGGFLAPVIPEPSMLGLYALAALAILRKHGK